MKKAKFTRAAAFLLAMIMAVGSLFTLASASTEYEDNTGNTGTITTPTYSSTSYAAYLAAQAALRRPAHSTASDAEIIKQNKGKNEIYLSLGDYTVDAVSTRRGVYLNGINASDPSVTLAGYAAAVENLPDGTTTIYLPESGSVSWKINVPGAGFYGVRIEYYPLAVDGKISSAEKKLLVDGELLFSECTSLAFDKLWTYQYVYRENENGAYIFVADENGTYTLSVNGADVKGEYYLATLADSQNKTSADGKKYERGFAQDINGNDMRSDCAQNPAWLTYTLQDPNGLYTEDLQIYFSAGEHELTLGGIREGLLVKSIVLFPTEDQLTYADYSDKVKDLPDHSGDGSIIRIEAEKPDLISDSSVYPTNDRSSSLNSPTNPSSQLLNVIGKEGYSTAGQWASYTFAVTKSGYYNFVSRFKQTTLEGMFATRALKLWSSDGEFGLADGTATAPFAEANNIRFNYANAWQTTKFGYYDADNAFHEFTFYLKEGVEYHIVLEVSLGDMATVIDTVENSLSVINDCYLNILKLTGTQPDEYRSYNFNRVMPNTVRNLKNQAAVLTGVVDEMKRICGVSGSNTATLNTIAILLEKMGSDEDEIAPNLGNLKSYIGNLGTWLNTAKQQMIMIDYMTVQPTDAKLPRANSNFFQSAWFEIRAFVSSFFTDYNAMGVTSEMSKENSIDVWLAYGRDQSQIWRNLIDDDFTSETGIPVTLKLVTAGTLLPSVLCGKGPDVYIGLAAGDTINYAIRSAITPLSQFEDLNDFVIGPDAENPRFAPSALVPLQLYGETYGIPETSSFSMMFLRNDILENLGIAVPETWDDLLAAVPVLQANNMQIGTSYASQFNMYLYQRGGGLWLYNGTDGYAYDDDYAGAQIGYGTNTALDAFADVCRLYTDLSFPVTFDAANRFRTGEVPLMIADYVTTYNQLTVFATEIAGMWQFTLIPGTEKSIYDENGDPVYDVETGLQKTYVDHTSMTTVTATVMLHNDKRSAEDTLHAWEFMKWQGGDKAQATYGNKMVALIGPSAKYASANTVAISNLSWTATELANIKAQLNELAAIENYPGSYYVARYVQFAFYNVVNDGADPADALQSYINTINKEITRKRQEFELPTLDIGQTPEQARKAAGN